MQALLRMVLVAPCMGFLVTLGLVTIPETALAMDLNPAEQAAGDLVMVNRAAPDPPAAPPPPPVVAEPVVLELAPPAPVAAAPVITETAIVHDPPFITEPPPTPVVIDAVVAETPQPVDSPAVAELEATALEATALEVAEEPEAEAVLEVAELEATALEVTEEPEAEAVLEVAELEATALEVAALEVTALEVAEEPEAEAVLEVAELEATALGVTEEPEAEAILEVAEAPTAVEALGVTENPGTEAVLEVAETPDATENPDVDAILEIADNPTVIADPGVAGEFAAFEELELELRMAFEGAFPLSIIMEPLSADTPGAADVDPEDFIIADLDTGYLADAADLGVEDVDAEDFVIAEGLGADDLAESLAESLDPEDLVAEGLIIEELNPEDLETVDEETVDPEEAFPDPMILDPVDAEPLEMEVIPVGIQVGDRVQVSAALVRGEENGIEAVALEDWLVPFEALLQALQIQRTVLESGEWELRSPGLVTRLDPDELQADPDLGLAMSVAEIEDRFGVPASFEIGNYALRFDPPWSNRRRWQRGEPLPVITEGLPLVPSEPFTVTALAQRMDFSGRSAANNRPGVNNQRGELTALGGLAGGSWFLRMNQQDLFDSSTWNLGELQYLNQTDAADYALGSQSTFWRNIGGGQFWGVTTIQRFGYEPAFSAGSGGFNPALRRQADVVGRTITGEAPPNTLVQLILNVRSNVIAETLVDSSGIYRFEDVPARGGRYEVLLFPDGQLTAEPEIRAATFSTLPSRLAPGTSVLVASAGGGRVTRPNSFLGDFETVKAGAAYRYGLSDQLTLGAGVVQDTALFGLGELFYEPDGLPVRLAVALLGGDDRVEVDAALAYEPSNAFRLDLTTDRTTSRFRASWQAIPSLRLRMGGSTRENALIGGATFSHSDRNFNINASVDYTTANNLRWSLRSRMGQAELNGFGNELSNNGALTVKVSEGSSFTEGHFLLLGYEARSIRGNDDLATMGWRYRSPGRAIDGRYQWEMDVGYGLGSQGNGALASFSTAILPGVMLRARYEGISVLSSTPSYRIELVPFANTQARTLSQDSRYTYLRQEGGLWIQPFLDHNGDGHRENGDNLYLDNADLLISVNNEPLRPQQFEVKSNGIFLRLPPGLHRIDLDPAGFPIDWQPNQTAYAVEVTAGSYTPVPIPMTRAHIVAGRVLDPEGNPVAGVRVEALPQNGGDMRLSVTNRAGIYYLEDLRTGTYQLRVNGRTVQPNEVTLTETSEGIQEVNLQLSD